LPPDESPQFFPGEVFGSTRSILARDYSRYLRSMGEKPLTESVGPECPHIYRALVVLRPYNSPVVVRLSIRADGLGEVVAKVGQDGGHPQYLTVTKTSVASRADVDRFLKLLDESGFWSMPTQEPLEIHHVTMGDESWMLEGDNGGKYRAVVRAASKQGSVKDPATFLVISLAKLDLRSLPIGPRAGR
jgi:hypothetical protein